MAPVSVHSETITVKDSSARLNRFFKELESSYTKVGFPIESPETSEKHPESEATILDIAIFSEMGTEDETGVKIPPRPFMLLSIKWHKRRLGVFTEKIYDRMLSGKISMEQGLSAVGGKMQSFIQKTIRQLKTPPNAPSTVEKKKSSNPLIDEGALLNSVTHVEKIG